MDDATTITDDELRDLGVDMDAVRRKADDSSFAANLDRMLYGFCVVDLTDRPTLRPKDKV